MFYLWWISITPGFLFLAWIMYMDRRETEPLGLTLRVMGMGALSAIPAYLLETAFKNIVFFQQSGLMGAALYAFGKISPIEEFCKLSAALLIIWNNPNFNEENDGIVYVGASALGFATLENILFVTRGGFSVGVARALTAMPLHAFTGIIMGYFIGLARFATGAKTRRLYVAEGFCLAWLIHGAYDTLIIAGTPIAIMVVPLIIGLMTTGIIYLNKGRQLSLKRWAEPGDIPEIVESDGMITSLQIDTQTIRQHRIDRWKIVVSRTLLVASVLFWILLTWAFISKMGDKPLTIEEFIGGGVAISVLPILIGIGLETSYYRSRSRRLYTNR